ncbi:TetR/AcrR family transcriptional regulator [Streptosporangium oxazolinicum]
MSRNSEDTRRRILEAGTAEFAAHGIAGARVARIAAAAGCNKQLIYAYFTNKEGLYDAVYDAMVTHTVESVPMDPLDLPGYAGSLFDHHRRHPEFARLTLWFQLERDPRAGPTPAGLRSVGAKLEAIRDAQDAGAVSTRYAPEELLLMILRLSSMAGPGSGEAAYPGRSPEDFRRLLVRAVSQLTGE